MNKFKNLTANLIKNKLWCSEIGVIYYSKNKLNGKIISTIDKTVPINAVISSVDRNLINNDTIFATDSMIIIDNSTLSDTINVNCKILFNNDVYNVVQIIPFGILNNDPTGYKVVIRK